MQSARRMLVFLLGATVALLGCRGRGESQSASTVTPGTVTARSATPARPPAVAGQFYPAAAGELRRMVQGFLSRAQGSPSRIAAERRVVGVVAPHAGYVYSGLTAAHAFASLAGRSYDTVLLLGSPHRVAVRGACVYTGSGFETPLGVVSVEQDLARTLASAGELFGSDPAPHLPEHSLEVELPFLQEVLKSFTVVPILVAGEKAELDRVAAAISSALDSYRRGGKSVLVVVSTDLAHYPSREDAEASDRQMLDSLCTLQGAKLLSTSDRLMALRAPGLECAMCGIDAAYVGVEVAKHLGASEALILHESTSADAGVEGADSSRVVGYGAVALLGALSTAARFEPLGEGEQGFLLRLARRTIAASLEGRAADEVPIPDAYRTHFAEHRGVFVTLTIDGNLRGCIGSHEPDTPLEETVRQMALASAFQDPRFRPLGAAELGRTRIEISVYLTGLVPIASPDEYVVGRHGIILRVGQRAATFLPQVPVEQGWDRETTLRELCLKAGLSELAWRSSEARFTVYETQIFAEAGKGR